MSGGFWLSQDIQLDRLIRVAAEVFDFEAEVNRHSGPCRGRVAPVLIPAVRIKLGNVTAVQSVHRSNPRKIVAPSCSGFSAIARLDDNLAGVSYDFRWLCGDNRDYERALFIDCDFPRRCGC